MFVTSMNGPGRYQPERQLPGGIRTHQETRLSTAHGNVDFTIYQPPIHPWPSPSHADPPHRPQLQALRIG